MQHYKKQKRAKLKSDCSLVLYIAKSSREDNFDKCYEHKNLNYPPLISRAGKLRKAKKSDLVRCLQFRSNLGVTITPPAEVIGGVVAVHFLPVGKSGTFIDYDKDVFIPYITLKLERSVRVDIVWDAYQNNRLKLTIRKNKRTGPHRGSVIQMKLPGSWKNVLRNDK